MARFMADAWRTFLNIITFGWYFKYEHEQLVRYYELNPVPRDPLGPLPEYVPPKPNFEGFQQKLIDKVQEEKIIMKTIDLSIRHIGQTVRIERKNIVGTHNYIEGLLEHFNFDTESAENFGGPVVEAFPTNITATIAGYQIHLNGNEPLTIIAAT